MATGAVMSVRRTFELAGRWGGDHHDGVPIHVLTHHTEDGDVPPGDRHSTLTSPHGPPPPGSPPGDAP